MHFLLLLTIHIYIFSFVLRRKRFIERDTKKRSEPTKRVSKDAFGAMERSEPSRSGSPTDRILSRVSLSPADMPFETPIAKGRMVKSRLEINLRRLLVRCETLAASSGWKDTWRSQEVSQIIPVFLLVSFFLFCSSRRSCSYLQYLNALTELLAEVKSAPK